MPKSKRTKLVSLTKTPKRANKARKTEIIDDIKEAVEHYRHLFLFTIFNFRSTHMKDIRIEFKEDSRIFFCKNRVMSVALGKTESEEAAKNLHKFTPFLKKQVALLFTNRKKEDVIEFFQKFQIADFGRSGNYPNQSVVLEAGPIDYLPASMEETLVKLELPISIKDGKVVVREKYTVCSEGKPLTPEQAKLLELLGIRTVTFRAIPKCVWTKKTHAFEILDNTSESNQDGEDAAEEEVDEEFEDVEDDE